MAQAKPPSLAEIDAIITSQPGFELAEVVINGIPQKTWAAQPATYRDYLLPRFQRWADKTFIDAPPPEPRPKGERESITYGEALEQAFALAGWLRERGAGVGSKIGIVGFNSIK